MEVKKEVKEKSELYLKGMSAGIRIAYQDIRDLLNERLDKIEYRNVCKNCLFNGEPTCFECSKNFKNKFKENRT